MTSSAKPSLSEKIDIPEISQERLDCPQVMRIDATRGADMDYLHELIANGRYVAVECRARLHGAANALTSLRKNLDAASVR